ncbi:MAG: hypothetical protein WDZ85_01700 [Candidatus Paceibacterota bacterium]
MKQITTILVALAILALPAVSFASTYDDHIIRNQFFKKEGVGYKKTMEYFISLVTLTKIAIPQEFKQEIKDARSNPTESVFK